MEKYDGETVEYEVFSANMTMDTKADMYFSRDLSTCKSCQCNCRLCLGGMAPKEAEFFCKEETESALENLLAA